MTLLLLPGLAGDAVMWREQLAGLAEWKPQVADVHVRHGKLPEMAAALLARYPGPLALCGASMVGMVPGADLVLLPECGHMLTMEQPQAVNEQLRRWLERQVGRAPLALTPTLSRREREQEKPSP